MSTSGWEVPDKTPWQISEEVRVTLEALENQVYWLLDEWIVYRQLYGSDQERIDLFNETARHFFGLLQYTLRDSVVLQICRITDPPKVAGHNVLVIQRLCQLAKDFNQNLGDELEQELKRIDDLCKPIREWRNNKVAHLNLDAHLDEANNPMTGFSRQTVQDAIDAIKGFVNKARLGLADGEFYYDALYRKEGVRPLLIRLIQSYKYFEFEQQDPEKYDTLLREGKWGSLYAKLEGTNEL